MFNTLIERLPDNYKKNKNSNVGKLYQIYANELLQIKETFEDIRKYQDVDNAINKTLDHIGKNVLELRNTDNDNLYRQMIKTKIIANLSQGDIETINQVASVLIGDSFVGVKETWNLSEYENEPAGLALTMRNQALLLDTNSIDRAIAGGVGVKYILELRQDKDAEDEEGNRQDSDVYIASVTLCGEEITVYPYSITELEVSSKIYVGSGENRGYEEVTVYPRKEVL